MFRTKKGLALSKSKGFTLIELLVVIAIIAILASIVLASLNIARTKSRDARRIADIKQIQTTLELYFDTNLSVYPTALSSLTPTYISSLPSDPLGAAYTYERCSATSYHLGASLEGDASSNPALNSDADSIPTGCTGTWQSDASACSIITGQGTHCYDVRP